MRLLPSIKGLLTGVWLTWRHPYHPNIHSNMGIDPQSLYLWSSMRNFQIIWTVNSLFGPAIVTVSITIRQFLWILLVLGVSRVIWSLLLPKFYEAPSFLLQEILNSKGIVMHELSSTCIPESDCTAASVYIYVELVWYTEPFVHQINFASSPVSTWEVVGIGLDRENSALTENIFLSIRTEWSSSLHQFSSFDDGVIYFLHIGNWLVRLYPDGYFNW